MSMNKRGRVRPTHEWDLLVPLFEWPELLWALALLLALIHSSAWNMYSRKFAKNNALKGAKFIGDSSSSGIICLGTSSPLWFTVGFFEIDTVKHTGAEFT